MLTLKWSIKALIDFDEAQAYIAQENPFAAQTVAERIWQASLRLPETPHIGRLDLEGDTRHWVVQRTPYLIVYRVKGEVLEILRVWHGRRDWMKRED
ncbi:MAG TPA: type II toxin-antitoxin system RelE/ParE family toxin [Luteimonas sp.]|nr:type II toxin-antitoxin system RelE/ParE family toxin [Luteimonas sp.]